MEWRVRATADCTRPNCLEPGYHSEVHHSPDWAAGGTTDADTLFTDPPDGEWDR